MEQPNEFDELASPTENPEQQVEQQINPLDSMDPIQRQEFLLNKMKLKNKVLRYKELFPHLLQSFDYRIEDLDKMEIKELEYLLEELSICVNTRNSSGLTKMLYFETVRVAELGGTMIGLKLGGLQTALKENQAIHDCLNELSLKYENDMYMSPEIRLAYLTSTTILSLHKLNSTSNTINDFLSQKVNPQVAEKYKDL